MKTYLFDESSLGLLYVAEPSNMKKHWFFYILKSCILDTQSLTVYPRHALYNELSNDALTDTFYASSPTGPVKGNFEEANDLFKWKKRKVQLILPLVNFLMHAVTLKSTDLMASFSVPFDDTLAHEVTQSLPSSGYYTPGLLEYARITEITPEEAYTELKLEYETMHYLKMRGLAIVKKYTALIREVETEEDAKRVLVSMENILVKDTFL